MKLSIVVPVYGAENYLQKNMQTIVNQLNKDCELILVDDGSKDSSGMICDHISMQSTQVSVIHKINGGVSSARNVGIQKATGEYIVFVDSDDYVESNYISTILKAIECQDDLIFFGAYLIKNNENTRQLMKPWLSSISNRHDIETANRMVFGCKTNEPWDKVFKLKIIRENKITFPEDVNLGEDLIFILSYLKFVNTVTILDCPIYYHTFNENGLGQQKVSLSRLKYHDALFSKILASIVELNVSEEIVMLSYETILQILTNFVGKLYKNGYQKNQIYEAISSYEWYNKILYYNYTTMKSKLRRFLLLKKNYVAISFIFGK